MNAIAVEAAALADADRGAVPPGRIGVGEPLALRAVLREEALPISIGGHVRGVNRNITTHVRRLLSKRGRTWIFPPLGVVSAAASASANGEDTPHAQGCVSVERAAIGILARFREVDGQPRSPAGVDSACPLTVDLEIMEGNAGILDR